MMYIFSVLIGLLGSAKAQCSAAYATDSGFVFALDTCFLGVYTISCDENGDAFQTVYLENLFDGGSGCNGTGVSSPVNASEYTVVCDGEPCQFAGVSTCFNTNGSDGCDGADTSCYEIPFVLNNCQESTDEDTGEVSYTMAYCSSAGLMTGSYSDDACTNGFAYPVAAGEDDCVSFTGCEDYDGGDEEPTTTRGIECPTGVLNAVLDEGVEAPYIPLGLCNKFAFGAYSTYSMYECNSDGEVMQYTYGSTGCSGDPASSQVADFGDGPEMVAKCNEDLECKYVRMNIFSAGDDGSCPTDGNGMSYEFASFVGECITFNSTTSYMQSCTDTTATRDRYTNADCSGDAVETEDILSDFSECGGEVVECYMEEPDLDGNGNGNNSAGFKMGLVMVAAICNFLFL